MRAIPYEWTKARTDRLVELVSAGCTISDIAHDIGMPQRVIRNKMRNMGLTFNRSSNWTPERIKELARLWAEGLSASQIAARLGGVTRNAVLGKVHRLGIAERTPHCKRETTRARVKTAATRAKRRSPKMTGNPALAALYLVPDPIDLVKEIEVPIHQRKTILQLEKDDCRWPIGDVGTQDFHFCNRKKVPGLSYCEHHARRAYAPPDAVRRGQFVLQDIQEAIARKQVRQAGELKEHAEPEPEKEFA